MRIKPGSIGVGGGTGSYISTETIIKDGQQTLVVDIKELSPRESIDFITGLKEHFNVKFIGGEHGI